MKIRVGSTNLTKINGVKEALKLYPDFFKNAEVVGIDVKVNPFGHPKNIKETVQGAVERAKKAFLNCDYSFGLEGGLIEVPFSKSGFMEVGACAVYNGNNFYLGLSPAFEWPKGVTKMIIQGKADASTAFKQLGLTNEAKLGAVQGGIVGFLTNGKLTREEFTKYSIIMALIQLERAELY